MDLRDEIFDIDHHCRSNIVQLAPSVPIQHILMKGERRKREKTSGCMITCTVTHTQDTYPVYHTLTWLPLWATTSTLLRIG